VFLVSRYGSATVRFTVRRTSLLTQVSQLRLSSLATTVTDVAAIVVVTTVAAAERTSNSFYIYNEGQDTDSALLFFALSAKVSYICRLKDYVNLLTSNYSKNYGQ
jgi:hypothetical protein